MAPKGVPWEAGNQLLFLRKAPLVLLITPPSPERNFERAVSSFFLPVPFGHYSFPPAQLQCGVFGITMKSKSHLRKTEGLPTAVHKPPDRALCEQHLPFAWAACREEVAQQCRAAPALKGATCSSHALDQAGCRENLHFTPCMRHA